MTALPGFCGPSYVAQSPLVNLERAVNLYPETRDAGTPKAQTWYYATPGLSLVQTIGTGPYRGSFAQNGRAWVISGPSVYEVFANGTSTLRGTVVAGTDQGTIVSNGDGGLQLFIVVGLHGYVYNLTTNVLTLIADVDFPQGTAGMCTFLDGYGIVTLNGTADFQISALEDFTDWDALDIAQKSQTSDWIVSITADLDHKVIWVYGSQTTEIWWDSGAAAFPFEPVPNSILTVGAGAANATGAGALGPIWLAESADGGRVAMIGVGGKAKRISTHGVEAVWATYGPVGDAILWCYQWRGHDFYVFTFPEGTWVYDGLDQGWHEWLEWDQAAGQYTPHLGRTHLYAFGQHLIGSRIDGNLYALSAEVYADGTNTVRRMRRSPHLSAAGLWIICAQLQFFFQVGVGLASGQGVNPQVMLRISRDGGITYGTERWVTLGALGKRLTRVIFRNCGRWRDGVIELTITDPVITAITGADGVFEQAA